IRLGVLGLGLSRDVRLVVVFLRRLVLPVLPKGGLRLSFALSARLGRRGLSLGRRGLDLCGWLVLGGRRLRRGGSRGLAGGNLPGLLLLVDLAERHGKAADERTERAHEP